MMQRRSDRGDRAPFTAAIDLESSSEHAATRRVTQEYPENFGSNPIPSTR